MPYSVRVLKELDELDPKLKGVFFAVLEEIEKNVRETVKRSDFEELKSVVSDLVHAVGDLAAAQKRTEERLNSLTERVEQLTEAQKRTEERLNSLAERVEQLTEAQKRTEERLNSLAEAQKKTEERLNSLAERVEQLTEAQKRTEERLDSLTERVEQLTEAQKRTEERLDSLAEAQKKTEERLNSLAERVEQLAEAQKRTEERLDSLAEAQKKTEERLNSLTERVEQLTEAQKRTEERLDSLAEAQKKMSEELRTLTREHRKTREILGGLADTVGYGLEDKIFPYIADFARRDYNIEADLIDRQHVVYPDGRHDEVNIYVEGRKEGQRVLMVGECKARPSRREIDRLAEVVKRLKGHFGLPVHPFIVGYLFSPEVERYLREKHPEIRPLKSFEFEANYSRTSRS